MPLEIEDQKHFESACGYLQLGLAQEANDELENIDPYNRAAPEILALRVAVYQALERWELLAEVARRMAEFQPNEIQWRISFAYAVRRFQSIEAAREILLNAEPKFPNEAVIKYNLACYECVLGNVESAKEYLKRAFKIDPNWRLQALEDEDLKPLWETLARKIEECP